MVLCCFLLEEYSSLKIYVWGEKMAYKFNDIHTMTCSNPKCIANNVALLQLQKNYDKLLIENSKLKQENLAYKYNI